MIANEGLDVAIAGILDGLGQHERASWVMAGVEPAEGTGLLDDIYALVDEIPSSTDKHEHAEGAHACWRTRAQCLAEKVRLMIDEGN